VLAAAVQAVEAPTSAAVAVAAVQAERRRQYKSVPVQPLMRQRAAMADLVVAALTILPQVADKNHSLPFF
jgi:hypothetical protein